MWHASKLDAEDHALRVSRDNNQTMVVAKYDGLYVVLVENDPKLSSSYTRVREYRAYGELVMATAESIQSMRDEEFWGDRP